MIDLTGVDSVARCESSRSRVVTIAASQIGVTDPTQYWLDVFGSVPSPALAWCGIFALWSLRRAGITARRWTSGVGFLWCDEHGCRTKSPALPLVRVPEVGDIAYFDQPKQHYAIVEGVGVKLVYLIAGNTPDVSRSTAPLLRPTYYSIAPWLPEAERNVEI